MRRSIEERLLCFYPALSTGKQYFKVERAELRMTKSFLVERFYRKGLFYFKEAVSMEFEELYQRVSPRLKRIASFYGRRGYSFDRDDLYQEMTSHLWDKFKLGVPEGLNDTYIIKGCEFHILNYMRKEKEKIQRISLEEPLNERGDTLRETLHADSMPLDRAVDRKMLVDYIMNNGFSKREKDVFRLLLEGYTVREAGGKLGISHVMVVKLKNRLISKAMTYGTK